MNFVKEHIKYDIGRSDFIYKIILFDLLVIGFYASDVPSVNKYDLSYHAALWLYLFSIVIGFCLIYLIHYYNKKFSVHVTEIDDERNLAEDLTKQSISIENPQKALVVLDMAKQRHEKATILSNDKGVFDKFETSLNTSKYMEGIFYASSLLALLLSVKVIFI